MYQIELTEAALADLEQFSDDAVEDLLLLLSSWSDNPKPDGSRPIAMPDAPDDLAYIYQTEQATLYYTIYEAAQVIRVVAIFPRFSLN